MRARTSILAFALAIALAGCGGGSSHEYYHGGAVPSGVPVYRITPGAGTIVQPGVQAGFGASANVGGSYRLVWTGEGNTTGAYSRFWGAVYTSGRFNSITPGCGGYCTLQGDDWVSVGQDASGGQRVDFDSVTAGGINGFDFTVDREPVYFDLFIDGRHEPALFFFPATDNGGAISSVAAIPFGLTTQ